MSALLAKLLLPLLLARCTVGDVISSGDAQSPVVVQRAGMAGSIAELNRVNFYHSTQDVSGPKHWVVFFCVDWYPACQAAREAYLDFASTYERKLNVETLFQLEVRFAEVKCTMDKPLCNEQDIDTYPMVVHYRGGGERVAEWSGGGGKEAKEVDKLAKFLAEQMDFAADDFVLAAQEDDDEELPRSWVADLLDLPVAQQHPLQTAMHVAPYAAATVGMLAVLAGHCADLAQGLRQLSQASGKVQDLRTMTARGQPAEDKTGLSSRLPEAWARQRPTVEL